MTESTHTDYHQMQWEVLTSVSDTQGLVIRLAVGVGLVGLVILGLWRLEMSLGLESKGLLSFLGLFGVVIVCSIVFFWHKIFSNRKHRVYTFVLSRQGIGVNGVITSWSLCNQDAWRESQVNGHKQLINTEAEHPKLVIPLTKKTITLYATEEDMPRVLKAVDYYILGS